MGKLIYQKGDLFHQIGKDRILVHACNCRGVWGSGIAVEFKKFFPDSFKSYRTMCQNYGANLLGRALVTPGMLELNCSVGCLFTSYNYGKEKDTEEMILKNTQRAIRELLTNVAPRIEINSPKFNAGLFGVEWSKTEAILKEELKKTNHTWIVWSKN